ncbi:hypothetical protein K2Y00_02645 [Patescibacteria group bacterium]|nr:hypothetical protein [Patescibacteria group bacterium]
MADFIESQNLSRAPAVTVRPPSSTGALITLVIVVAVIVIGALYVWGERVAEVRSIVPTEEAR